MRKTIVWILSGLLAVVFLAAGIMKLATSPMDVQIFASLDLPRWSLYAVGIFEVACAIGLLVPRYAAVAGALLVCDMAVAFLLHLTHGQAAMAPVPLVLGIIAAAIVYLRGGFGAFASPKVA
jgi:uncharacterized membrane protein YphA (DoxX/SURF4 family)